MTTIGACFGKCEKGKYEFLSKFMKIKMKREVCRQNMLINRPEI